MLIHFVAYDYSQYQGYGRYAQHMVAALIRQGVEVYPLTITQAELPQWLKRLQGWSRTPDLTITCAPPFAIPRVSGRHWALTMTEGSRLPKEWPDCIYTAGIERLLVPCEYNRLAFAETGIPTTVVPGGTDPNEFSLISERTVHPYTFLTLADRGARKGWMETYQAFFEQFVDVPDVRLII
jgi:hypothetical protein